jgi:hypothetical protein
MAKALFHKNQRVYVKPVGTWAIVERVTPQWVKGVDEPIRIHYDVGLGRDFSATELSSEDALRQKPSDGVEIDRWRLIRAKNRWQDPAEVADHPYPGTFPIVVTDENDWGGWRVPGSEYDRDPHRIEHQARMIANSPRLLRLSRAFAEFASENPSDTPAELRELAREAISILRNVHEIEGPRQTEAAE